MKPVSIIAQALMLACLCATAQADTISGSALVDFETGSTNNTMLTPTLATNSTKGQTFGGWVTQYGTVDAEQNTGNSPYLTLTTDASVQLYTPASINGTTYTGTGTLGMRATMTAGTNSVIKLTFNPALAAFSMGFYFRYNGSPVDWSPRDLVLMQDGGGFFQILQIYDQASGPQIPYFHAHFQSGAGVGNNVDFQRNTWYWVTIYRAAASGTMKVSFYEPTNSYALLGESIGTVSGSTGSLNYMSIGAFKYSVSGQSVDYDNIIINTNGVYPLGPGGGAGSQALHTVGTLKIQ